MDKKFYVEYTFPELPSGKMYQHVNVTASGLGMAAHKALQEIKKRPAVKGRRLKTAKVSIIQIEEKGSE